MDTNEAETFRRALAERVAKRVHHKLKTTNANLAAVVELEVWGLLVDMGWPRVASKNIETTNDFGLG